jgi:hypothetical protein
MNRHRWLAALFVMLALTGCAQAVPGQAHALRRRFSRRGSRLGGHDARK